LWTCKSLRKLSQGLREMGHEIGRTLVGKLLHKLDYTLPSNRKMREGSTNPDREAQFHYISDRVKEALFAGQPAISIDTKKKNWSATSRTPGVSGARRARPKRFASTTSSSRSRGEPRPMALRHRRRFRVGERRHRSFCNSCGCRARNREHVFVRSGQALKSPSW